MDFFDGVKKDNMGRYLGSIITIEVPEMSEELKNHQEKLFEEAGSLEGLAIKKERHKLKYMNDPKYKKYYDGLISFMIKRGVFLEDLIIMRCD